MANGVLIAAMNIAHNADDEFHDWYDTEHLPERQRVPGFLGSHRWLGAQDPRVSVATYDLTSVEALSAPEYLAVAHDNLSPWSRRVTGRCERLMRYEGEQILPGDRLAPEGAGGLLVNAMNVEPAAEAEFNEWYNKEHIPALAAVPGVICARRFRGTAEPHRRYVALYHLQDPSVVEQAAWKTAADTDWSRRMRPHFRDHLRIVCRRYARAGR
jgi:hypothetical protein